MKHALIDCQSVGPFWVHVLTNSHQVDPIPDVDTMLRFHSPTDMHTHQTTSPYSYWPLHVAYGWCNTTM
jgi:hypothetical protein